MTLRRCVAIVRLAVLTAVVVAAVGCVDPQEADTTERDAAIFGVVLRDLIDGSGADLDDSEELPVVFIEAFGPDGIALEVQIEVVNSFIDQYDIRFIDDRSEAIELDVPELSVRPNSVLLGFGPIVVDGSADLRSELYLSADDLHAYRYTLVDAAAGWVTVGEPEEIEPEGFVSSS